MPTGARRLAPIRQRNSALIQFRWIERRLAYKIAQRNKGATWASCYQTLGVKEPETVRFTVTNAETTFAQIVKSDTIFTDFSEPC